MHYCTCPYIYILYVHIWVHTHVDRCRCTHPCTVHMHTTDTDTVRKRHKHTHTLHKHRLYTQSDTDTSTHTLHRHRHHTWGQKHHSQTVTCTNTHIPDLAINSISVCPFPCWLTLSSVLGLALANDLHNTRNMKYKQLITSSYHYILPTHTGHCW